MEFFLKCRQFNSAPVSCKPRALPPKKKFSDPLQLSQLDVALVGRTTNVAGGNLMKNRRLSFSTLIVVLAAAILGMLNMATLIGQGGAPAAKKQRYKPQKPSATILSTNVRHDVVVIKFQEGTRVRLRAGQLETNLAGLSQKDEELLSRANLTRQRVFGDLAEAQRLVSDGRKYQIRRLFKKAEAQLDVEKEEGERLTGEELADLNLYYEILIKDANARETERLIDQLNALGITEIAYPQPMPQPAAIDMAPPTPNFASGQGYLGAAPAGVDAFYGWSQPGGKGTDVRVVDIEYGWNLGHEDMPAVLLAMGVNDPTYRQHGTAVLGVVGAAENTYGVSGIAPETSLGVSSVWGYDVAAAINDGASYLRSGDMLIIELHAPGPIGGFLGCNPSQYGFLPMENWISVFDAIRAATARGVTVVEAAGNGSMDLDNPIYGGAFNRAVRDSGAILVGGGTSGTRMPMCWTNYGSRVDVQGWGENVVTLGYGDLAMLAGSDDTQWYTGRFSGTSSASPVVAGAVASIQGFRKAHGLFALDAFAMRSLLAATGSPQSPDARNIGPLPNIRAAIDTVPKVSITTSNPDHKEGLFSLRFTVNRTGPVDSDLVVNYFIGGTATPNVDYPAPPGSLIIPAGSANATINVQGIRDNLSEVSETVVPCLIPASHYVVGIPGCATGRIWDLPMVTIAASVPNAYEYQSVAAVFTINISPPSVFEPIPLIIRPSGTASSADYTGLPSGTYWIPPNTSTLNISITPIDDNILEPNETLTLTVQDYSDEWYGAGTPASASITIVDNKPTVTVTAVNVNTTESMGSLYPGLFIFERSGPPTSDLFVNFKAGGTAIGGVDYPAFSSPILIPAGQNTRELRVSGIYDSVDEPAETVVVTLLAGPGYVLGTTNRTATVKIWDLPVMSVNALDPTAAEYLKDPGTFRLTLLRPYYAEVGFWYALNGSATQGADYALTGNSLFSPGATARTLKLVPVDDALPEPTETATLTLLGNPDCGSRCIGTASATITILDNDSVAP
jgi:serine protease